MLQHQEQQSALYRLMFLKQEGNFRGLYVIIHMYMYFIYNTGTLLSGLRVVTTEYAWDIFIGLYNI